jgi:hypothetical protein
MTIKLPPLPQLFKDAMDWGRDYGSRPNNTPEMLDEVATQFADKALAAIEAYKQQQYGECDECGTPYSFDPTDGGTICVRCLKEKLEQAQQQGEAVPHWCTYCQGHNAHNCQFNMVVPRMQMYYTTSSTQAEKQEPTHPAPAHQPLSDPLHDDIQSVLFEVEQAVKNGCCPWQIKAAFEAYEAAQRLQQPAHGIGGEK